MDHRSILVVEDEPSIREAIVTALRHRGFSPESAGDGNTALKILETITNSGVFLVDLLMPGEDGWHLVERIREHASAHGLAHKIVIISGLHNAGTIAHLETVGFLAKPFTIEQLLTAVNIQLAEFANALPSSAAA